MNKYDLYRQSIARQFNFDTITDEYDYDYYKQFFQRFDNIAAEVEFYDKNNKQLLIFNLNEYLNSKSQITTFQFPPTITQKQELFFKSIITAIDTIDSKSPPKPKKNNWRKDK